MQTHDSMVGKKESKRLKGRYSRRQWTKDRFPKRKNEV